MFPSILSCPSCKDPLIPSSDNRNEGTCHSCNLVITWNKVTSAPPSEFNSLDTESVIDDADLLGSVEIVEGIEAQYKDAASLSPKVTSERITKFSKLGKEDFRLKNSTEKILTKYEDTVYAPNKQITLTTTEQAMVKPQYTELSSTPEERKPEKKTSKLSLYFIISAPILFYLAGYLIYKEKTEFPPLPEKPLAPVIIKKSISHEKAEKCLTKFFSAPSWQDALKTTLPDPKINESLKQYWTQHEIEAYHHLESSYLSDGKTVLHFFGVFTKKGAQLFYSVLEHPEIDIKVDWRTSHGVSDISLPDLRSLPQRTPISVRGKLKAIAQKHPSYPAGSYAPYRLSDPEDNAVTVFIPKNDPLFHSLKQTFQDNLKKEIKSIPVILRVINTSENSDIIQSQEIVSILPQEDFFFNVALPYTINSRDD